VSTSDYDTLDIATGLAYAGIKAKTSPQQKEDRGRFAALRLETRYKNPLQKPAPLSRSQRAIECMERYSSYTNRETGSMEYHDNLNYNILRIQPTIQ